MIFRTTLLVSAGPSSAAGGTGELLFYLKTGTGELLLSLNFFSFRGSFS